VKGCEVIYGKHSKEVAERFCTYMEGKGQKNRGIIPDFSAVRGKRNVEMAQLFSKKAILIEPFFGDNVDDYIYPTKMANYLLEFIAME
jgi:hypothetical protein